MASKDDWVIKESRTHKGTLYRYNTATQQSEWLTPAAINQMKPQAADYTGTQSKSINKAMLESHCAADSPKGHGRRPLTRSSHVTQVSWGTDDTADGSECICTICECGKHSCPVHGRFRQTHPFGGNSRYREDYPAHPLRPRDKRSMQKAAQLSPSDPDQFKSKYAEDFLPFDADPPKSMKPKASAPLTGPFQGVTTNRELHGPKPLAAQQQRRPPSPSRATGPFEGTTTNREAHRAFDEARPRESMAPPQRKLVTAPFDGTTQYKRDYVPLDAQAQKAQAKAHEPYAYGGPRNLSTEQRTAFTPKPVKYCPVLDLDPKDPSGHTGHIHYTKHERPDFKYFPGKPKETQ